MRRAALRRARGALADLKYARARREQAEADMIALLGELGVDVARICQIPGLSPATLAAILAETGDLRRYESSSSVVKHAGMSPARNESGGFRGQARISRRGRPALRLAAWRATWAVLRHCDVLAAKHTALTSRDDDRRAYPGAGPRCLRRVAAALDLVADRARHLLGSPDRGRAARPPPRHGRITAGQAGLPPARSGCANSPGHPLTGSEPASASRTTSPETQGSSPAPPGAPHQPG